MRHNFKIIQEINFTRQKNNMISPGVLKKILSAYELTDPAMLIVPYGKGLINNTWKITIGSSEYILQKINESVFEKPLDIEYNIHLIAEYLKENHPGYLFTIPVKTKKQEEMICDQQGYFRVFPFIKNSYTINIASMPQQAFEAARQFGLFTEMLIKFPVILLKKTIPDFHNLILRYQQFEEACKYGDPSRIKESASIIKFIRGHNNILKKFQLIQADPNFKIRVTHHDTKISNVLFDKNGKGLCVIDLDTVMPGYFISDVGDMMRTYLSPVSEEEKDIKKIEVREDFFQAIVEGYLQQMSKHLSDAELKHFVFAGKFMIYMQAIRFLTDHLSNDKYYGADYENQNFVRANNQVTLLQRIIDKKNILKQMINHY